MDNIVMVDKEVYEQLLEDQRFLECLRANGVDNWEYWDDACEMFHEEDDE